MKIESYTAGAPSWVDLMTVDQDAAIAFYCDLFGWQCMRSGPDMGNYGMCFQGDAPVAGIGAMPADSPHQAMWTTYIDVQDADAVALATVAAGGQVMADVADVPGRDGELMGRMAIIMDPAGGILGVWEPHGHKGSGVMGEPGAFAWNELVSRDAKTARDFLEAVFGYEWAPTVQTPDGMEYFTGKIDGQIVVGAMDIPAHFPADVPSHWQTYFGVADTDEALARAVASGGKALGESFNSPHGRMAVIEDPQGAQFSIVEVPSE